MSGISRSIVAAIIEDHPMVRDALRAHLLEISDETVIAYSGASIAEAIGVIHALSVDIAILDLDLGDGQPPLSSVTSLTGVGVPVLVVSALGNPALVRAALLAGAHGYLSKNAEKAEFVEAVQAILQGHEYVSHELSTHILESKDTSVHLSDQERKALVLYASGLKLQTVARRMDVSFGTAQEYIKRVREKYLRAGIPLPTKTDMYRVARDEGLLP
jgi:DNA-binding NarL/FixJ family response regulator